jgi:hypothetical protein
VEIISRGETVVLVATEAERATLASALWGSIVATANKADKETNEDIQVALHARRHSFMKLARALDPDNA